MVGGLEGFRLIDIALLNEFLQTKVDCRQCAKSSLQDQLRQFAAFADGRGADTVTDHLQAYLHNLARPATRKNAGVCGVQIVSVHVDLLVPPTLLYYYSCTSHSIREWVVKRSAAEVCRSHSYSKN